jgi:hypothetical protein
MDALTAEERTELNAWIAEHVYHLKVQFEDGEYVRYHETHDEWQPVDDYATEWGYAGPLFDRYPGFAVHRVHDHHYTVTHELQQLLASGTTGPEAIAKAVKAYEEQKRT